jgi:hypothetical protein
MLNARTGILRASDSDDADADLWWPNGNTDAPLQQWDASPDTIYPSTNPRAGKQPASLEDAPTEWREVRHSRQRRLICQF